MLEYNDKGKHYSNIIFQNKLNFSTTATVDYAYNG